MISFQNRTWNTQTQQELLTILKENTDPGFLEFNRKIVQPRLPMLGVRAPMIQRLAEKISQSDWESYFACCPHEYYEQVLLHGITLGNISCDFQRLCELLEEFIPWISDWAACDMTCGRLKAFAKNPKQGFSFACQCIQPHDAWKTRFGLVLMLSYFVNARYISSLFEQSLLADRLPYAEENPNSSYKPDIYFVRMANAWMISVCFIKFKDQTMDFLKNNRLNEKTLKFAIQKIRDSKRVSQQDKQLLATIKR